MKKRVSLLLPAFLLISYFLIGPGLQGYSSTYFGRGKIKHPTPQTFTPKLLFTFDDGYKDTYTVAMPILNAKGFKATAYVCRDWALQNSSTFMNTDDINSLYNNYGWDIGNHTVDHNTSLGSQELGYNTDALTLNKLKQEYYDNEQWLLSKSWTRAAYHAAYPYGVYTNELVNVIKGLGIKTGRAAWGGIQYMPVSDFYSIPVQDLQQGNTSTVNGLIDSCVRNNSSLLIMIHHVLDEDGNYIIKTSDFKAVVDYAAMYVSQGKLQVTTISNWYDSVK